MATPAAPPQPLKLHPTVLDISAVRITRVYAQALYGAAAAAGQLDDVLEEYEALVRDVVTPHPELERLLDSAVISRRERQATLRRLFEGRVSLTLLNYLLVLNSHGRMSLVRPVLEQLRAIHNERTGRVPVVVCVAVELDATLTDALRGRLRDVIGGEPLLDVRVDPTLLGGLVVRVGDTVYDASIKTKLRRLRELLDQRAIHEIQSRRDQFSTPA